METSNRRLTLFEQMSAVDNGQTTLATAAFTVDDILGNVNKRPQQSSSRNRTLMEVIFDHDKKSWKAFRDKIRFKWPVSAQTSSVTDDIVHSDGTQLSRRDSILSSPDGSTRVVDGEERSPVSDPPVMNSLLQLAGRDLVWVGHNPADVSMPSDAPSSRTFGQQTNRDDPNYLPSSNTAVNVVDRSDDYESSPARHGNRQFWAILAEERALSLREAEEATAAATTVNNGPALEAQQAAAAEEPLRKSLMELLEETTQQTGLSSVISDEEEEEVAVESSFGMEQACCVCMVRHKGAAFIPCGHTFCRVCSRELWVQRGNCPLCNDSIFEILYIF